MKEKFFEETEEAKRLSCYKLPRYEEFSEFGIYMEQLIYFLDKYLNEFLVPEEEKYLTPSMINNYVQKKVIPPPIKKKYHKEHIVHLIVIGMLKQILPIPDITSLIRIALKQYPIDVAYDYFCREIENTLNATFQTRKFSQIEQAFVSKKTPLSENFRSAVLSFVNRVYVRKSLYFELQLTKD